MSDEEFAALFAAYWPRLLGVARRLEPHDPEDLAAETFCRAWRARQRFAPARAPGDPIMAWLGRIAHNLRVDRARRRAAVVVPLHLGIDVRVSDDPASEAVNAVVIAEGLARLTDRQAAVLRSRFLDDQPRALVADRLGVVERVVTEIQQRGLRNMRRSVAA